MGKKILEAWRGVSYERRRLVAHPQESLSYVMSLVWALLMFGVFAGVVFTMAFPKIARSEVRARSVWPTQVIYMEQADSVRLPSGRDPVVAVGDQSFATYKVH